jgi:hypothetical protein
MATLGPSYLAALWALAIMGQAAPAPPDSASLLPNPSFELVEPPPPSPDVAAGRATLQPDDWLPRTWNLWSPDGAVVKCPDDPAQAHSGRRCAHLQAQRGTGQLRYGPMPAPDGRLWTVRLWARGKGKLAAVAYDVTGDVWKPAKDWPFDLDAEWEQPAFEFQPPDGCRKWMLDLVTRGPTDVWIDDVVVAYPGLTPLGLPPARPLARDANTLLYLPFEEPLSEDTFFVEQKAGLTDDGLFGKALGLGPGGYVSCSASGNLDPTQGTIEVWCKLLSPGSDNIARPIILVPGPEGMWLGKDQYSHVGFQFSSGWGRLSGAVAMGYAYSWQPGVWRHIAACWDKDLLEVFVDGKLIAWQNNPKLSRALGPELSLGSEGMELDDLRISNVVRYRQLVPPGAS